MLYMAKHQGGFIDVIQFNKLHFFKHLSSDGPRGPYKPLIAHESVPQVPNRSRMGIPPEEIIPLAGQPRLPDIGMGSSLAVSQIHIPWIPMIFYSYPINNMNIPGRKIRLDLLAIAKHQLPMSKSV